MKILHIIDNMSMGGAQSLLVELLPALQDLGDEVDVLELRKSKDRTLAKKIESFGIPVFYLSEKRSERNPYNIFCIAKYLRKYDVVHVHLFPANYWTAAANFLSTKKIPIITTEHSTSNKRRGKKLFKLLDTLFYSRYYEVIACGNKAHDIFVDTYPKIKCISIPNGVNIKKYLKANHYTKTQLLGIPKDSFLVTMVARFVPSKRHDTIINAIKKLDNSFHAAFVGGTPEDSGLKKIKILAEESGVADRIHFLYTRSDVPSILKTSDAVVLASDYEGLSLSSIEGMASGRPFIASNVDGLKEIVTDAGILFENGNAKHLIKILNRLKNDSKYYKETVNRCIERAKKYDIAFVAKEYKKEYINAIKVVRQNKSSF